MTFHQRLEMLCESRGITVTALAVQLGFSNSAGTTWKKSKGLPRNSTLKKIADYFDMTVLELKEGIDAPIDYDSVDTSGFNQPAWQNILAQCGYDEHRAIDRYFEFEKAQMQDAVGGNNVQDNHGVIGTTHAPVTIVNGSDRKLSAQGIALLEIFEGLDVVKQAQLLAFAADLAK